MSIKYKRVQRMSARIGHEVGKYPGTFSAIVQAIPDEVWQRNNSKALALIVDIMRAQTLYGYNQAPRENL